MRLCGLKCSGVQASWSWCSLLIFKSVSIGLFLCLLQTIGSPVSLHHTHSSSLWHGHTLKGQPGSSLGPVHWDVTQRSPSLLPSSCPHYSPFLIFQWALQRWGSSIPAKWWSLRQHVCDCLKQRIPFLISENTLDNLNSKKEQEKKILEALQTSPPVSLPLPKHFRESQVKNLCC